MTREILLKISAVLIAILASFPSVGKAQTPASAEEKSLAIDSVAARWQDWESVTISGKFKMHGLPLSPSVKIFMQRDSLILISLRAPFVGEVGRAEIADSTILVVNKMKKTYVEEPIDKALAYYPGGVSDLQNLILGRIVIPGFGCLARELSELVEIYPENNGTYTLVATKEAALPGFNYGYMLTHDWRNGALMVLPVARPDIAVVISYEYFEKGYDMTFVYQSEKKNYSATLELQSPEFDTKGFERIRLSQKFTKVDFDKFLKSF